MISKTVYREKNFNFCSDCANVKTNKPSGTQRSLPKDPSCQMKKVVFEQGTILSSTRSRNIALIWIYKLNTRFVFFLLVRGSSRLNYGSNCLKNIYLCDQELHSKLSRKFWRPYHRLELQETLNKWKRLVSKRMLFVDGRLKFCAIVENKEFYIQLLPQARMLCGTKLVFHLTYTSVIYTQLKYVSMTRRINNTLFRIRCVLISPLCKRFSFASQLCLLSPRFMTLWEPHGLFSAPTNLAKVYRVFSFLNPNQDGFPALSALSHCP